MSEFVKAVGEAEEQFRKELPGLLKKAAKKHSNAYLLFVNEGGTPDRECTHSYCFKDGGIFHALRIGPEGGYTEKYPVESLSYENFTERLSLQQLRAVAEKLVRLGY